MRWMGMFAVLGWFSAGCSDAMLMRWDWVATDAFGIACAIFFTVVMWREVY